MNGHPTVPIVPVLMALSDEFNVTGIEFITAFIAGYEVETRLAEMSGFAHYDKGWHGTATYGTFGAAAAAAKLLGLDTDQTITALGIAATQAAGLKSMFGTMCKPLHAGKAASKWFVGGTPGKKKVLLVEWTLSSARRGLLQHRQMGLERFQLVLHITKSLQ